MEFVKLQEKGRNVWRAQKPCYRAGQEFQAGGTSLCHFQVLASALKRRNWLRGTANLVTNSRKEKKKNNQCVGTGQGDHLQILRFKALINKEDTEA